MNRITQELSLAARLLGTLAPLALPIGVSVVLRVVNQGLGIALLGVGGWAVGTLLAGHPVDPWPLALGMVALGVTKAVARYGEQVMGHGVAFETLALLRKRAFDALGAQAPVLPQGLSSGDLVSRLVSDIDRLEVFYAHTVGPVVAALVLGAGVAATVAWVAGTGPAVVVAVGFFLVAFGVPAALYPATRKAGTAVRQGKGRLSSLVSASLRGAEDLYWSRADLQALQKVDAAGDTVMGHQAVAARFAGLKDGVTDLVISLTILGAGALAVGTGWAALGTVVALAVASFAPALSVGRAFDDLPETAASADRLFDILDAPVPLGYPASGPVPPGALAVEARGLGFGWDTPLFQDFDLRVPAGSRVAVVGPSGSGKSTLARLLVRFLDPQAGAVSLGGLDARLWPQDALRRRVVYLDQDSFVLDDTVVGNLTTFRPGASADEWRARLDAVGLWPGDPGRLDRPTGPRGRLLSGGERKRLTLARALGGDPGLVVLDEAFNNLDAVTRAAVRSRFLEAVAGITVVEVTHEEEDTRGADLVVDLRTRARAIVGA